MEQYFGLSCRLAAIESVGGFVGAEGTLGVITELTLKLYGLPDAVSAGVCRFPTIKAACNVAIAAIQNGLPMARIELVDDVMVRACNAYSKLNLSEAPMLFVEFHRTEKGVSEQAERFGEIARECGSSVFEWAIKPEDRTRYGRRGTISFGRCSPSEKGHVWWSPTFASPSPGWPSVSSRPNVTLRQTG